MSILDEWLINIQSAWFAPRCPVCATAVAPHDGLCAGCRADVPFILRACEHCALPIATPTARPLCGACIKRPRFDRALAACHYREPIASLIAGLKYGRRLAHARVLGDLLAERIAASGAPPPDVLAPVPLHPAAFRRRGFNQAERLARRVARRLDWPLDEGLFARVRDTPRQSTLDAAARAGNVRGAFATRAALDGRRVALVDDVMTTGRTAAVLARCARRAGAADVAIYCVARA